jgi:hypothetical protein
MTALPNNIQNLLEQLSTSSRQELDLVLSLAEAIRRADEQVLREVRSVTLQHEIRREAIVEELHTLATRLCCLPPKRPATLTATPTRTAIRQQEPVAAAPIEVESKPVNGHGHTNGGGHWREAAQKIDEELDFTFGSHAPRH